MAVTVPEEAARPPWELQVCLEAASRLQSQSREKATGARPFVLMSTGETGGVLFPKTWVRVDDDLSLNWANVSLLSCLKEGQNVE